MVWNLALCKLACMVDPLLCLLRSGGPAPARAPVRKAGLAT